MPDPVFEIFSEVTGRLQFSLLARLPELIAIGTHGSGTNAGGSNTPGVTATRLDIGGLTETAFIAIRPTNPSVGFAFTYAERINGVNRYNFMVVGGSGSFDYWVFDYPPLTPATSGVVFETYDAGRNVQARLHMRPAIVAGFISMPINAGSIADFSMNVPSGRRFAVAIGMRAGYSSYQEIGTPDGQPQRYRYFYRLDTIYGGGATIDARIQVVDQSLAFITDPNQAAQKWYYSPRNNMVIDVTAY